MGCQDSKAEIMMLTRHCRLKLLKQKLKDQKKAIEELEKDLYVI